MKKLIYIIMGLSTLLFACDDDFLDVSSTNLTDDLVWSAPATAEAYIVGLYNGIKLTDKEQSIDEGSVGFQRGLHWAFWSSISDETIYSNDDETYLVQRGQLSPSLFGFTSTAWGRSYRGIRECNLALEKVPTMDVTDEYKNTLIAEIKFIRAWRYFILMKGFGGVPLIGDRVTYIGEDYSDLYSRSTVDQTAQYIVAELDAAAADLPSRNDGNWERGRATSEAALALKSRALLYAASPLYAGSDDQAKWQAAADAAEVVMGLGFSLVDNLDADPAENYRQLFISEPTNEDIFMREFNVTSWTIPIEKMNAPNGYGGWGGNCPMQNFVDDFEMTNGLAIDEAGSGYDDQDPYTNRDPRFYASVLYNGADYRGRQIETYLPGGQDSQDGPENWNTSPTGYYMRKFFDENIGLEDWDNMGTTTGWRYIRYAEILLNFAEAENEANGPTADAYAAVNQVRDRAGMPDFPAGLTKAEFREKLRNERRIELAFEEHRYFDVRRWEIAMDVENQPARRVTINRADDGTLTFTYNQEALSGKSFGEEHYWFPIPLDEINASGGALVQNPNY
ncbi:MAG: RagB/SusD family nutrient uptake outer membrane protein [Reichenbachiella sp.]|uniref:RagB/SusD family nutrient uptake outer membrane protein n=1 Tax=Reichenbachiella sp. TaxID=2184521 RepID=UPI0032998C88